MKTTFTLAKALIATMLTLGLAGAAHATLIGDVVNFQCTNCGPPTNNNFVVTDGLGPELTLFNQFSVDVESSSLRIEWLFNSSSIISDINFVWSDLDIGGGGITGALIDASSTWGIGGALNFSFNSVDYTNNADSTVSNGDFLLINLSTNSVSEPGTLALGILGVLGWISGRKRFFSKNAHRA